MWGDERSRKPDIFHLRLKSMKFCPLFHQMIWKCIPKWKRTSSSCWQMPVLVMQRRLGCHLKTRLNVNCNRNVNFTSICKLLRGHSTTTWTKFDPNLITLPPLSTWTKGRQKPPLLKYQHVPYFNQHNVWVNFYFYFTNDNKI